MIHTTRWSPDTCGCVIEYEWDDTLPDEARVHTDKSIVKCQYHSGLDDVSAHAKVKKENTSKNIAHGHILDISPELTQDVTDKDGNIHKEFKSGIRYDWSFDADRNLVIYLVGATKKQKDDALNSVKVKLGDPNIKLK